MMASGKEHYLLKSKDFDSNIKSGWRQLQEEVDFCDVTLGCGDNQIRVHKFIISTFSPVLKCILKKNPHQHPLIYLRGVESSQLVNLIEFIYQGEVKIPRDEINNLLQLAKDLQVTGLFEKKKEEIVVDGDKVDSKKNHSNLPLETVTNEIVDNISGDDVIMHSSAVSLLETDFASNDIQKNNRTSIESAEDLNVSNETKRNNKGHFIKDIKEELYSDQKDITDTFLDYDFQAKNYNNTLQKEIGVIKENLDYSKQFSYNENESLIYNSNPEKEEEKYSVPVQNSLNCEECNAKFSSAKSLSRHMKKIHQGLGFSCDKCQYTTTESWALYRHVQSIHDKIRFSCNLCDFSATQKPILTKHLKVKH